MEKRRPHRIQEIPGVYPGVPCSQSQKVVTIVHPTLDDDSPKIQWPGREIRMHVRHEPFGE